MTGDDLAGECEAEAEAAVVVVPAVEEALGVAGCEPGAVVTDDELDAGRGVQATPSRR